MFTLEQIDDLHDRLRSPNTLAEYVRALKAIGVDRYGFLLGGWPFRVFRAQRPEGRLATSANASCSLSTCAGTNSARRTYLEMAMGLAESGIENWTVDTAEMTFTFYDKAGRDMLVEQIN